MSSIFSGRRHESSTVEYQRKVLQRCLFLFSIFPRCAILKQVNQLRFKESTEDAGAYHRRMPQDFEAVANGEPYRDEASQSLLFQRVDSLGETLVEIMELQATPRRPLLA